MRVVALAGGVGGSLFLLGLRAALAGGAHDVTVIGNTGDDLTVHGLRVCPDLDTVMYTLGGGIDTDRGWGRSGETWTVLAELAAYGVGPSWFGLGDRDIATHLVRTRMLDTGYPLSAVTAALCDRWQPGVTLLPMTDQRVETHVAVDLPEPDSADGIDPLLAAGAPVGERRAIHFQEWWLRHRARLPAHAFIQVGVQDATPAPGVTDALCTADLVILAPSNPVVSVGTILGVPGIRDALLSAPGQVVGLSPIVGGAPLRGMADACLRAIGVATTAEAVGRHYGARADGGVLDAWLVDERDAGATVPGVDGCAVPLLTTDAAATEAMARATIGAGAR
ncbi:MAG: 2-phospho-L-lactate transferase [Mycobacteriales bacterium]